MSSLDWLSHRRLPDIRLREASRAMRGVRLVAVGLGLLLRSVVYCQTATSDSAPVSARPTVAQAVLLDGRPFPARVVFSRELRAAARTFHVSGNAPSGGDGTRERPWNDLSAGLRALSPGDRLVVLGGEFRGPIRVDDDCQAGIPEAPIQVVFEKTTFRGAPGNPILMVARPFWRFEGFTAELGEESTAAFVAEGDGAHGVVLDRARISGGGAAAVRIGAGASDVTVANSRFSRSGRRPSPSGAHAVSIEPGANGVRMIGNTVFERPSGAVRIGFPAAFAGDAAKQSPKGIVVESNTFAGSLAPAVHVHDVSGLRISANTILSSPGARGLDGRGIVVEAGTSVRVEGNHLVDASVGVQVGFGEPRGGGGSGPENVLVARNYFESRGAMESAGVDVESGRDVRIANNVFEDISYAFLFFGSPPRTERLVVANNLVLRPSGLAFRADDLACAVLFDGNVFSPPPGRSVGVEIAGKTADLRSHLSDKKAQKNRLLPGVRILQKDLGRIEGVTTRDAGLRVEGVVFQGSAPDLGVAEH